MVTYTYNISSSGPTTSVQSAIDIIVSELSLNPTIENDIEINIDRGNYSGFTIPDGALFPLFNTSYKLVIKSAGSFFPIIDFNYSDSSQVTGIDIGSGNPNVVIQNIRVQFFAVGIRAGLNSHFPIVKNCIVSNNRNVGIFFEQCAESQAIQNVIINGDYGIVSRGCRSSSIVHNTIFSNGGIASVSGKSISCIWAELATDYGNGVQDTGRLHLVGNIAWNTTGRCLTLFVADLESNLVTSNFNNWVKGDPLEYIVVEDNAFYRGAESRPRVTYSTLAEWKQAGQDANSKSDDPRFISPVKIRNQRNGYAIDLNILPVSPVLGIVPSFAFDTEAASEWLPSYFDTATILRDIIGNNRAQTFTAAGANDKRSTSGFFGQDVFSNPIDLDILKKCNVDPFSNILYKSLDLWFPKINKGYFYSNEREYYLYSKKKTITLGESAETTFSLPAQIIKSRPIKVTVGGVEVTQDYYDIISNSVILFHKDLPIFSGDEEINIQGFISSWNGNSFNYNKVLYRFKIKEGTTRYFLPPEYVPGNPVVITDDKSYTSDSDIISNREYYLEFDKDLQKTEIKFSSNSNHILNCQFDYYDPDLSPSMWQSSGASVIPGPAPYLGVAGPTVCSIEDKGYIRTLLPVSSEIPYVFTMHAMSLGNGLLSWKAEFFDSNYDSLGVVETGLANLKTIWNRYSLSFASSGEDYSILVPQVPYPCSSIGKLFPPTRAANVLLEIKHIDNPAYTGTLLVDATQYEQTELPTLYHRKPFFNEMTIEFESSNDPYFIDTHLGMASVTNTVSDGFVYIPEVPASVYGGPSSPAVTTLHEWRWPEGRSKVMPWARTKGKDKLRKRIKERLNSLPEQKPEILSPVSRTANLRDIEISPTIPSTFVGDDNGVGISLFLKDSIGNPCAFYNTKIEISDTNLKYPGVLSKKLFGLKEQLSPVLNTKTDNGGVCTFTWIPPSNDSGIYKGNVPLPRMMTSSLDRISYIQTEYPISLQNYGNVIIFDNTNKAISTVAASAVGANYTPVLSENYSTANLKYPISYGSVKVIVGSTVYRESDVPLLEENQFFVDYLNSSVAVKGRVANIYIEYIPSYVFVNPLDRYKILLYYDKIFGSYENNVTVGYDFSIDLKITAFDPSNNTQLSKDFELIAQNQLTSKSNFYNPIGFEF